MWLTVYENSQLETGLKGAVHVFALADLLLQQSPLCIDSNTSAELAWERVCVESCIYHLAVMNLFDEHSGSFLSKAMMLQRKYRQVLEVTAGGHRVGQVVSLSPVLAAPVDLYIILIQAIEMVRRHPRPPLPEEEKSACHQVTLWQTSLEESIITAAVTDFSIGDWYIISLQAILSLLAGNRIEPYWGSFLDEIRSLLRSIRHILPYTWGKFLLLPLAIFGTVMFDPEDTNLVEDALDVVLDRSKSSTVALVKQNLKSKVWTKSLVDEFAAYKRLRSLLDARAMRSIAKTIQGGPDMEIATISSE
ncbi:hypothetical protein M409DRAFT_21434 [Zasmidium cellare ATCC 36951]|uniref:Uncharacterized protein n=1 Tax=Zasmidium cellare ATCC 36951 TaxID=1080233 RepID=A0A6A6CPU5_ZASCE|nr:uncharacterized protein M409DRAFT_21434 [Zasmidium cellare ATCC 36951]KAF2168693.1 hypothetical protein M409DRAFT_21434 [Zasmidium cellare ATCC 36951]